MTKKPRSHDRRAAGTMSRRAALALLASGGGLAGLHTTGAISFAQVPRQGYISVGSDSDAILGITPNNPHGPGTALPLVTVSNYSAEPFTEITVDVNAPDPITITDLTVPDSVSAHSSGTISADVSCSGTPGETITETVVIDISVAGPGINIEAPLRAVDVSCTVPTDEPSPVHTVDLIAGQHCVAGTVRIERSTAAVTVTYDTSTTEWVLRETHAAAATVSPDTSGPGGGPGGGQSNIWQDQNWQTRGGNPAPGQFPSGDSYSPAVNSVTHTVSVTESISAEDTVYVAAHAVVQRPDPNPYDACGTNESAWGDGTEFNPEAGWAMFIVSAPND